VFEKVATSSHLNNTWRKRDKTNKVTMAASTSQSTAYSGTINDSPWSHVKGTKKKIKNDESGGAAVAAVVDEISPFEKRLNETATTTSRAGGADFDDPFQVHTSLSIQQQQQQLADAESSCRMTTIRSAVHFWIWTDLLFGLVWGFYGLALLWRASSSHPDDSQMSPPVMLISLVLIVAALLLSRFLAASLSLRGATDHMAVCGRCGLLVSAYIAPILSIVYVTTFSVVAAAGRGAVVKYLHQYHLTRLLTKICLSTPAQFHGLLIVLLVLAVTECIQWQVYQEYRRYLLRKDAFELLHPPPPTTARHPDRRRRPWWWESSGEDASLTRHLLVDDTGEANLDGQATDPASGQPHWTLSSPFRQGRRRHSNTDSSSNNSSRWWGFQWRHPDSIDGGHDVRDDGSVDFAEVQEEWASRTEEDPFWWSRPEDHGGHGKHGNHRDADISWAEGKDDDEEGQRDANPK
jgi:hypothetical protein